MTFRLDQKPTKPTPAPAAKAPLPKKIAWVIENWELDPRTPGVVVISDDHIPRLDGALGRRLPDATVTHLSAALDDEELHVALAAAGPTRLIVDRSKKRPTPARLQRLLLHTEHGGVLISHLGTVRKASGPQRAAYEARVRDTLADYVSGVRFWPTFVALRHTGATRAVIRERQMTDLLTRNPGLGEVLETRPSRDVVSTCDLSMSEADHPQSFTFEWTAPELALRAYRDVVSAPGQIVESDSVLLADSLRRSTIESFANQWTTPIGRLFVDGEHRVPKSAAARTGEPPRLTGTYFHLDNEIRGHFGHTVTEVVSRFWGWPLAKERFPDAKALIHANNRAEPAGWERELFATIGIDENDLVYHQGPVRVDRLVTATPMFSQPRFAHPDIVDIWRAVGDQLETRSTLSDTPRRIFIGRRIAKRPCRNGPEVEDFFRNLGFTIVYPEDHPLGDQVRIFRNAEVISGFAGSGMFGLMWALEPKQTILVASESYTARNEWLMAGLLGHEVDIAWCRSEGTRAGQHWARGSFQAPYAFDFAREGEFVRAVVAELPD